MTKRQLTRTCTSCGQQKPLSAFLQLTGSSGASYGSICSTCRSKQSETKPEVKKEPEEQTTSSSGYKIDAKVRLQVEIEKKKLFQRISERDLQEKKKTEKEDVVKQEQKETLEKTEKDHRQSFLEPKKQQSFFELGKKSDKKNAYITQASNQDTINKIIIKSEQEKKQAVEAALEKEQVKTKFNLNAPYQASFTGEEKEKSVTFRQFKDWLGTGAAISKDLQQLMNEQLDAKEEKQARLNNSIEKSSRPKGR